MEIYYPYGKIAYPLEAKARDVLHFSDRVDATDEQNNVYNQFFGAGQIWAGNFVEVMFFLLRIQLGTEANLCDFAKECQPCFGVPLNEIPQEKANTLYAEFKKMMGMEEE